MAGTVKSVRFKLAWQAYRVGDVITPNGTLRDWLVANGYVDVIDGSPAAARSPAGEEAAERPARLVRKAAAKVIDTTRSLIG